MNRRRITDIFQIDFPEVLWSEVIQILRLISARFPTDTLHRIFNSVNDLYHGNFPGYKSCSTGYHDFSHATAVFLAMARMIHGAVIDGVEFSERDVVTGLAAAILHDAGYIQDDEDRKGTGAKHKPIHEQRSMDFLSSHGREFGLSADEISSGHDIIRCTDMQADIESVSFASRPLKLLGKLLAVADLLAQLSDQHYLEKLLYLYHECRETGAGNYKSEADIIIQASPFYDVFENRLKLLGTKADRYLKLHFASRYHREKNLYQLAIEKHKHYLAGILSSKDADPCRHLRRGGIVTSLRRQTAVTS